LYEECNLYVLYHDEVFVGSNTGKESPIYYFSLKFTDSLEQPEGNEQSIKEGSWLFKYSLEHAERE